MMGRASEKGGSETLLITDLAQVVSPRGTRAPLRGPELREQTIIEDAYILCERGKITGLGRSDTLVDADLPDDLETLDGRGACAIPGLVDCHTHPAFGGDRVEEFVQRSMGTDYSSLLKSGGILHTVRATRELSPEQLIDCVAAHRRWMMGAGTTLFEGKSGYGLDLETEIASLQAIQAAGGVPTWLGGHLCPEEFDDSDTYIDFLLEDVLTFVATIAEAADIFVGRGGFSAEQGRRYLLGCAERGLASRIHGDQFSDDGAVALAIDVEARSIDHLESSTSGSIKALATSDVIGVLLPASALFLGLPMPKAREFIDAGGAVALATDFNPGSSFCESLPLICSLAATQLKMSPAEALAACTVNGAAVLARGESKGRLALGYDADITLLDTTDWRYMAYHMGADIVKTTIVGGVPAGRAYALASV